MKIKKAFPPNYEDICAAIPGVKDKEGIVFTYGDTIYNPDGFHIDEHLDTHESVHEKQQTSMGIDEWWAKYLADKKFRLEQEIEAYRIQYRFVVKEYGLGVASAFVKEIARDLSGPMYGNILKYKEARKEIMK